MQLFLSAGLILVVVLWGLLSPATLSQVFDLALAGVTRNFGWFYLWVVLALVLLALLLAFSRYGDLKLGVWAAERHSASGDGRARSRRTVARRRPAAAASSFTSRACAPCRPAPRRLGALHSREM